MPALRRCLLIASLLSAPALAEPLLIVSGDWPPFVSASLPAQGVSTSLLRAVMSEAGLELQLRLESWPRAEALVRQGEVFAAFPYMRTAEREKSYRFSTAFMPAGASYLFYYRPLRQQLPELRTLDQLAKLRVVSTRGYWYEPAFARRNIPLLFASDEAQQLQLLVRGHGDVAVLNYYQGWYLIGQRYPQGVVQFANYPHPLEKARDLSLLVSKTYPDSRELLQRIEAAISRMQMDGRLERLKKASWQAVNVSPPPEPERVLIPESGH